MQLQSLSPFPLLLLTTYHLPEKQRKRKKNIHNTGTRFQDCATNFNLQCAVPPSSLPSRNSSPLPILCLAHPAIFPLETTQLWQQQHKAAFLAFLAILQSHGHLTHISSSGPRFESSIGQALGSSGFVCFLVHASTNRTCGFTICISSDPQTQTHAKRNDCLGPASCSSPKYHGCGTLRTINIAGYIFNSSNQLTR